MNEFSAGVDYVQSPAIRIDELPIHLVQARRIETNQTDFAPGGIVQPQSSICDHCKYHEHIHDSQSSMRQNSGHSFELMNYLRKEPVVTVLTASSMHLQFPTTPTEPR